MLFYLCMEVFLPLYYSIVIMLKKDTEMALRQWDKAKTQMHTNDIFRRLAASRHVCPRLPPLLLPVPEVIVFIDQHKFSWKEYVLLILIMVK